MEKDVKKLFPLEFQKLNKIQKKKQMQTINPFVEVESYQTTKFKPSAFYKPISKIIAFEVK